MKKKDNKKKTTKTIADDIESLADAFEQINEMIEKGIPFEIIADEEDSLPEVDCSDDLGFLQDEEDIDDLEFDEMNDIWEELDEEDEEN